MADEFEIIPNPDNVPGAISSGYQRQNTLLEAQRNGIDLSYVSPVVGQAKVLVNISGGVDVNGVIYVCKEEIELSVSTGTWYIKLVAGSNVNFLTPTISSDGGTFDPLKGANYNGSDERILNWVIVSNGTDSTIAYKIINNVFNVLKRQIFTSSGIWLKPSNIDKVKVLCIGAGGSGGNGTGYGQAAGGGGGGAGQVRESILNVTDNVTVTVSSISGSNSSFGTFISNGGSNGTNASVLVGGNGGNGGGYGAGGGGGGGGGNANPGFTGGSGGVGGSYELAGSNGTGGGFGGTGGTGGTSTGKGGVSQFIGGALGSGGGGAGGLGGVGGIGGVYAVLSANPNGGNGGGYGAGGGGGGGSLTNGVSGGIGGLGGGGIVIVEWVE